MMQKSGDRQKCPICMKFTQNKNEQILRLLVEEWMQSDVVVKSYEHLNIAKYWNFNILLDQRNWAEANAEL